jgi:UDPglucose 6-dehydrogenase
VGALLRTPVIFDGRNIYRRRHMIELGFTYYSVGRPPVNEQKQAGGRSGRKTTAR